MKNTYHLTAVKLFDSSTTQCNRNIKKSLKTKIWTLKFYGKYDCFGTEYLIGKLNVFNTKDIYRISDMMFSMINSLIRVDISMEYKLDE